MLFSHWLVSVQWLEKRIDRISVLNLLSELICDLACDLSWRLLLVQLKIMCILPLWDNRNTDISSNAQTGLKTSVSGLILSVHGGKLGAQGPP